MNMREVDPASQPWVLQFCHGYDGPFLDCARQYAALFKGTPYKVCTVYLTGAPSIEVEQGSASDEVIFLNYSRRQVRGLKLRPILGLRRIASTRNFEVCIAHRFKPIYIALLATPLPVIGVHHAFGNHKRPMRRWFINRFRQRLLLLGVSNAVRDEMRDHLSGWEQDQIETLYNRIDVATVQAEQLPREAARAHLGLPQEAWVVGNVGRLHPDKDQATLMRGFAQALPGLPAGSLLAIMGSGKLEGSLRALAGELGVNEWVRFLGQVPNGRRYFKAFDVFALSSDHEPFGMVLLEAMSAGVPVIGTDCGGGREVVQGIGELFALGDADALAKCLQRVQALSAVELAQGQQRSLAKLKQAYSDEAVRPLFWQLKQVVQCIPLRTTH